MERRSRPAIAVMLVAVATALGPPQARAQSAASFDVVSVKRNTVGGGTIRMMPGNFTAIGISVRMLIRQAFQLQEFQIVGGPDWISSERFDIEGRFDPANAPPGTGGPARIQAMLRTLLTERFGLVARQETRELPVYALVLASNDRQLGPQLKPAAVDCTARRGGPPPGAPPDGRGGSGAEGRRGGGPGFDGRGEPPRGGAAFGADRPPCSSGGGFGVYSARGTAIAQLTTALSQLTGRTVVDRTGLNGGYDFDLKWSPSPDQLPPGPPPPGVELPPIDPDGPSLFTALQEQLGLRLESERAPVQVLVIDRVREPAEN